MTPLKPTVIPLTELSPKKHSVRFDTTDPKAPVQSIYISRDWPGIEDALVSGVRVTIQPIETP